MTKEILETKHRAICEDDDFKGSWRKDIKLAKQDARNHRQKPGNQYHVTRIITQQTSASKS